MGCAIPQVDGRWNYVGPRKEGLPIAAAPAPAPAPVPVPAAAPVPVRETALNITVGRRQQLIDAERARLTVVHTRIRLTAEEAVRPQVNRFEAGDYADDDAVVVE
jgi:hypothetical protein